MLAPPFAVNVPPVQVVDAFGVAAIATPAGKLSVKPRLVAATVLLELLIVNVSVLVPPVSIGSGEKTLLNTGGGLTVNVSPAVPLLPDEEVRLPVVFACVPNVLLVTSTWTVQVPEAATVPPV